jgi:hypothetical protein
MKIQQIKNISPKVFINIFLLILSVFALLQPAIYNHYPLCHPDLGSYLVSGFEKTVDQFRPFLYGFLLRHISMGHSLWFVVVFQAIIFSFSVFLMFKYVFRFNNPMFKTFIASVILSSLTTMGFYVCHVIADIYSGLGIIAVIILFNPNKNHWLLSVYAIILMIVSGLVHYSNLGTYTVIILILVIFSFVFIKKKWNPYTWKKLIIPFAAVCSLWVLMPFMNKVYGGANRITSNNEIIHMARLIETGIASEYLHDKCGEHNYELCNYLDYVDSRPHPSAFVWNFSESPIYKGDCRWAVVCWEEKAKEYKIIIDDMLKTPKYRKMIIWRIGIDGTYRQFIKFGHQTLQRQRAGTPAFITVKKYFPNEFQQFYFAIQQDGQEWNNFKERNLINKWTVILSSLIVFVFILFKPFRKSINASSLIFLIISFIYLLVNAATCSIFSSVSPRYQDRIIWLVPMAAIILIINYYNYSKKNKNALQ